MSPRRWIIALPAICLSCDGSSVESPLATAPPGTVATFDLPLYAAVESELGYSFPELLEASNRYEATMMSECLADRGFEVGSDELVRDWFTVPADQFDSTRRAIEQVGEPSALSAVPPEQLDHCIATEPSPIFELNELLAEVDSWVADRVSARPEIVSARARTADCRQRQVPTADPVDLLGIVRAVRDGSVSAHDALTQVDEIAADESRQQSSFVADCGVDMGALTNAAVAEEQAVFLDQHPTFISDTAESYAPELARLLGYLEPHD